MGCLHCLHCAFTTTKVRKCIIESLCLYLATPPRPVLKLQQGSNTCGFSPGATSFNVFVVFLSCLALMPSCMRKLQNLLLFTVRSLSANFTFSLSFSTDNDNSLQTSLSVWLSVKRKLRWSKWGSDQLVILVRIMFMVTRLSLYAHWHWQFW